MGISEQFDKGIERALKIKDEAIESALRSHGNEMIHYSASNKQAGNITFNLQDSYGYAVYHNRRIVGYPMMLHSIATEHDTEGGYGSERGKRFLEQYRPKTNYWTLVIVAGEFYADFLEKVKHLDILTNTMFKSDEVFSRYFKKIG